MASININRRMNDDHYRYKMTKLQIKTQGSTTILTNLNEIAKELDRSPIYILKFFGYKFSTSITVDERKNLFALGGIRTRDILQDHLFLFIDHFVLCSECENPETKLFSKKQNNDEVYKKCLACGTVTSSKMQDAKITKSIAKDLREKGIILKVEKIEQMNEEEEENELYNLLKDKAKLNDVDIIQKILNTIREDKDLLFIAKTIFTENIRQEIIDYKNLLQQLCQNNRQAQLNLLSAFETIIINQNIIQTKIIEEILFNFYNEDIIDEDTFLFWYQNCLTQKSIRKLINGFIQWLNNSD